MHCYRILGSFQDAEDVLQEAVLAAWQAIDRFDGRYIRAWLYRIATNRCFNYLRDTSRRPHVANLPETGWLFPDASRSEDPWWLEPYPDSLMNDIARGPEARYDARESIALSFIASLQHLPNQRRAALVLRDVLGFSAAESAAILETTPAAVNSALQRARAEFPTSRESHRVPLPSSATQQAAVLDRFVAAFERGDVEGVLALLNDDPWVTMPPEPFEFRGRAAVANHLYHTVPFWGQGLKLVPTGANKQPAFGYYLPDRYANVHRSGGILVLDVAADGIASMTRFADRSLAVRFWPTQDRSELLIGHPDPLRRRHR
jgi:RNA polymerase sigma-70 factor (ECF subfamily)